MSLSHTIVLSLAITNKPGPLSNTFSTSRESPESKCIVHCLPPSPSLSRWSRLQAAFVGFFTLFCTVSVVYAIIGVRVFAYLKTPLTYPLLYVAGDFNNMRSSRSPVKA